MPQNSITPGPVVPPSETDASKTVFGDGGGIKHRLRGLLARRPFAKLGPGFITGVADDDPSGIATYSQAGAAYGYTMLWTMPLAYPLMSAVQELVARLGRVTGMGLTANMKRVLPLPVTLSLVALLVVANTLNIAADVAAMGETAELMFGIGRHAMTALFAVVTLTLQVFLPYHRYVHFLKWLTVSLLAYVAVLFVVHVDWRVAFTQTLVPHVVWDGDAMTMVTAIFGTTISPYLFFWQASEEVEDLGGGPALVEAPEAAVQEFSRIRSDTWLGMLYSHATAYFIIVATAVTLHAAGIARVETAAQAASALRPLAGQFAGLVFAIGIIGVGLIGVPVLAGSAGYAVCEALGFPSGLERRAADAKLFYAIIAASVLLALVLQYLPIGPMHALVISAVINGIVAVPLLVALMILVTRREIVGRYRTPRWLLTLTGIAVIIMGCVGISTIIWWSS